MAATERTVDQRQLEPLPQGFKVLVVGVFPDTLPIDLREHDRIICWGPDSPQARRGSVPPEVSLILTTRFVNHSLMERIESAARSRHVRIEKRLYGTGAMRRALRILIGQEQPTSLESVIAEKDTDSHVSTRPNTLGFKLGAAPIKVVEAKSSLVPSKVLKEYKSVNAFVRGEFSLKEGETIKAAAARLHPRLADFGLTGKLSALIQACGVHARQLGIQSPKSKVLSLNKEKMRQPKPPVETSAQPAPVEVKEDSKKVVDSAHQALLQILDDAMAALQLAKEQVVSMESQNKKIQERYEKIRRALESD